MKVCLIILGLGLLCDEGGEPKLVQKMELNNNNWKADLGVIFGKLYLTSNWILFLLLLFYREAK